MLKVSQSPKSDQGISNVINRAYILAATAAAGLAMAASAHASVVFSDNFNTYAYQLDWTPPPAVWTAPGPGTVDLIGETTSGTAFDFYPGNGGYVDLDGSNSIAGTLETADSFGAGTYTLVFDLGGNARNDGSKTTTITIGDYSKSITLAADAPYALHSLTFTTTGGQLSFADLPGGNGNIGNILDNVGLATGVPEPRAWALMLLGFGAVGAGLRSRRRLAATA
jgi:hypothetical protein